MGVFRSFLWLALPAIGVELIAAVGKVSETWFLGKIDTTSIAALSIGYAVTMPVVVFSFEIFRSLEHFISVAIGKGDFEGALHYLTQALYSVTGLAIFSSGLFYFFSFHLDWFNCPPSAVERASSFVRIYAWAIWPAYFLQVFRYFLLALGRGSVPLYITVVAVVITVFSNWVLTLGNLGFQSWGIEGVGWSNFIGRGVASLVAISYLIWAIKGRAGSVRVGCTFKFSPGVSWQVLRLGLPHAGKNILAQLSTTATVAMLGTFGAATLASYHILSQMAFLVSHVAFGIASASSIKVGQAIGKRDVSKAMSLGRISFQLMAALVGIYFISFCLFPHQMIGVFSKDQSVVKLGAQLAILAALAHSFNCVANVVAGSFRGLKNTVIWLKTSLVTAWFIGIPIGAVFAFTLGLELQGFLIGALTAHCGSALYLIWAWRSRAVRMAEKLVGL